MSTVTFITGLNTTNPSACTCQLNYYWDKTTSKCLICTDATAGILNCCKVGFYFRITDKKCVKNCSREVDRYASGSDAVNVAICVCDPGFIYSTTTNTCNRNCAKTVDPNAASVDLKAVGACLCVTGFMWRPDDKVCVRKCTK